ncbi:MAG: hypothetical protein A2Y67_02870 [Candidatus Buchananbacteria bacterium RBG_13_39_9]|uniref:Tellurite resistance methyltransferase TehB-like domain-containing protein n=1 Tax=Candidatus Buchananbacteria bacterium RBG_13_39_9 TaxID=1797531 RepID=A0A1G1XSG9_9BACT|nr:MAG: hypothetical protein A2Y67_02870 [Candidatus Buchananbacteria bacterium RBG_13_39_9]
MDYNKIYKSNSKVWGSEPNKLLAMVWQKLEPGSEFLDLGCGQGRDSLFMASKGFKVTAVDESAEGIKNLQEKAGDQKLENIKAVCGKIIDFKIENKKYSIINAFNILQLFTKTDALRVLEEIKEKLNPEGFIIIAGFTTNDPAYSNKINYGYFEPDELKKIFNRFKIIFYKELKVDDPGHAGYTEPHQHGVVRLIVQKLKA